MRVQPSPTQRRRQSLVTRARIATAGVVIAAASATGAFTVAAAHVSADPGTPTTTDGSHPTSGTDSTRPSSPSLGGGQDSGGSSGSVAGSHSS